VGSLTDYAVFLIDLSGSIRSWNPGVRAVLGYDEAEFVGLDFARYLRRRMRRANVRRKNWVARCAMDGQRTNVITCERMGAGFAPMVW